MTAPRIPSTDNGHLPRQWVLFAGALRASGISATLGQVADAIDAIDAIGVSRRADVRDAARTIFVATHDQIAIFDRLFDRFWRAELVGRPPRIDLGTVRRRATRRRKAVPAVTAPPPSDAQPPAATLAEPLVEARETWSAREVLRRKDFAELDDDERAMVRRLVLALPLELPPRRTRRTESAPRGHRLDVRRTLRASLRTGGELHTLHWRRRRQKPRPLVALCDISGSMKPYARIFLQLLYALGHHHGRTEAFVFATRLTRITRELRHRDVDQALQRAAGAVVDWGGGTRIGEVLRRFNHDWGRRVLGQGAVVAVISDGWDRGNVATLRHEVGRLRHSCARLLWLNPLLGSPGYQPLTRGIRAVLPLVDDFLPIHNLTSLEALATHLASIDGRRWGERPEHRKPHHGQRMLSR